MEFLTNPRANDTDGDTWNDGVEVACTTRTRTTRTATQRWGLKMRARGIVTECGEDARNRPPSGSGSSRPRKVSGDGRHDPIPQHSGRPASTRSPLSTSCLPTLTISCQKRSLQRHLIGGCAGKAGRAGPGAQNPRQISAPWTPNPAGATQSFHHRSVAAGTVQPVESVSAG